MAVYVDTMKAGYGRMIMCHMLADNDDELLSMADRIGVARKWHQYKDTPKSHFDICKSKRALAIKNGAVEITVMDAGRLIAARRRTMNTQAGDDMNKPNCPEERWNV